MGPAAVRPRGVSSMTWGTWSSSRKPSKPTSRSSPSVATRSYVALVHDALAERRHRAVDVAGGEWSSFTRAVTDTILLVVVTGSFKLIIGLGLALVVNERIRMRGLFRAILLLPWAMPAFVVFVTWKLLFQPLGGGLNLVITRLQLMPFSEWVGIAQLGYIDWLGERALPSVIVASI